MNDLLPSIEVVIPAFNAGRFLERAVTSVFATGYPALEVVIVDDGSSDDTAAVAERLCRTHAPHCRLLQHPDGGNHGVSASRNLGIATSTSQWVAFLDADDFYLSNRFDAFRAMLGKTAEVDAVYEMTEIRGDETGQTPSPGLAENRFGIDRNLAGAALLGELLQGRCWATSAITLRRALLHRTGGFDPGKRIAEDCDLWFRIAAVGRIVAGSLEHPVSVYWRHADNTYWYRPEHRIAMVRAMVDSWRWARRNGASPQILGVFADAVPAYVTRSIVAAREAKRPDVAWRLLGLMARARKAGFLLRFSTLRQVFALLRNAEPVGAVDRLTEESK